MGAVANRTYCLPVLTQTSHKRTMAVHWNDRQNPFLSIESVVKSVVVFVDSPARSTPDNRREK
jgi:hypothetical protein